MKAAPNSGADDARAPSRFILPSAAAPTPNSTTATPSEVAACGRVSLKVSTLCAATHGVGNDAPRLGRSRRRRATPGSDPLRAPGLPAQKSARGGPLGPGRKAQTKSPGTKMKISAKPHARAIVRQRQHSASPSSITPGQSLSAMATPRAAGLCPGLLGTGQRAITTKRSSRVLTWPSPRSSNSAPLVAHAPVIASAANQPPPSARHKRMPAAATKTWLSANQMNRAPADGNRASGTRTNGRSGG